MAHALGIDHITLTVSDISRSEPFYTKLLDYLGLKKQFSEYGFAGWKNSTFHFYISEAEIPYKTEAFNRFRTGLNHLSFRAETKEDVDELREYVIKQKYPILQEPKILKQFGYGVYYFAFADPDGIKLEFSFPL